MFYVLDKTDDTIDDEFEDIENAVKYIVKHQRKNWKNESKFDIVTIRNGKINNLSYGEKWKCAVIATEMKNEVCNQKKK